MARIARVVVPGCAHHVTQREVRSMEGVLLRRRPVCGRERPERDVLIYAIWKEGGRTLGEIGRYSRLGYASVVNARLRGAKALADNRSLRKKLKAENRGVK